MSDQTRIQRALKSNPNITVKELLRMAKKADARVLKLQAKNKKGVPYIGVVLVRGPETERILRAVEEEEKKFAE